MLAIVPWTAAGADESPFVKVMAATHVPGAAAVFNFVILVAALSAMNSQLYITTRMLFSLSRAGYAPRALGRINRHGVPAGALLLSTIGIAFAAVLNVVYPDASFTLMMAISMFGAMFTWLMIFVTHLFFRRSYRGPLVFRMWGFPVTSMLGAALMAAALVTTWFTPEFRMTLVVGVPFMLALSAAYWLWYRGKAGAASGADELQAETRRN
jgi:L-asparagine transporter-like permease